MKAVGVLCSDASAATGAVSAGRVGRHHHHHAQQVRRDVENEEIQLYLSKLRELVPFMPKNRKLSKLEVIQHVIDYICVLQSTLETHPAAAVMAAQFDGAAALATATTTVVTPATMTTVNNNNTVTAAATTSNGNTSARKPLGVRTSPNTILDSTSGASDHHLISVVMQQERTSSSDKMESRQSSC